MFFFGFFLFFFDQVTKCGKMDETRKKKGPTKGDRKNWKENTRKKKERKKESKKERKERGAVVNGPILSTANSTNLSTRREKVERKKKGKRFQIKINRFHINSTPLFFLYLSLSLSLFLSLLRFFLTSLPSFFLSYGPPLLRAVEFLKTISKEKFKKRKRMWRQILILIDIDFWKESAQGCHFDWNSF